MTPERYEQIEELCHKAMEQPAGERSAFLQAACGGDEALRREVESLLPAYENQSSFLEAPPGDIAADMLSRSRPNRRQGARWRTTRSARCWTEVGWARCIWRKILGSGAWWPSSFSPGIWFVTRPPRRAFFAKRALRAGSTIPTSAPFTTSASRTESCSW